MADQSNINVQNEIKHDLKNYQKSYKFVVYKTFLNGEVDGKMPFDELAKGFRDFYLNRKKNGLKIEADNANDEILNVDESDSNLNAIGQYIKDMPFDKLDTLELSDDNNVSLKDDIKGQINDESKKEIQEFIDNKLRAYYNERLGFKYDIEDNVISDRKDNSYKSEDKYSFSVNLGISVFKSGITVPVNVHDKLFNIIGHEFQNGDEFIDLIYKDKSYKAKMRENKKEHNYKNIQIRYDSNNELKNLLSKRFQQAKYLLDNDKLKLIPQFRQPEIIVKSTSNPLKYKLELINIEDKLHNWINNSIDHIKEHIRSEGFNYPDGLIENFYLSLKSKPFVLLAGISGTGKTKLVKLFAEAINCTSSNNSFKLISVRPDWNDSSDLLGYKNLKGEFIPGPMIDIIQRANKNRDDVHIVCLDEMNLARVEYYFSEFLSKMETREFVDEDRIETIPLFDKRDFEKKDDKEKYGELVLPDNLYIVGTVNMDETTHPFSKKVLDRANTIEFNNIDLKSYSLDDQEGLDSLEEIDNKFLTAEYLKLSDCSIDEKEYIDEIVNELDKINNILNEANLHAGYRIRDEIIFYMLNNKKYLLMDKNQAFDFQLMQKILPRIQGSSSAIKQVIRELYTFATGKSFEERVNIGDAARDYVKKNSDIIKYPKSAKKLAYMIKRMEEDRFTAYWL
ncbi:MAG: McrB family protein [bacterium]